jgi:gephyrin
VWNANAPMLRALIKEWGGVVHSQHTVADDYAATRLTIARAATSGAQVVVVTGGVSMGDRDFVKLVLEELVGGGEKKVKVEIASTESEDDAEVIFSGRIDFGRLLMKPGKPATLATLTWTRTASTSSTSRRVGNCIVLALPGNPVSALVCALVLLRPALRALLGIPWEKASFPETAVRLDVNSRPLALDDERPEYHRATVWVELDGTLTASSTGAQASSRLASASHANALLWLPQAAGAGMMGGAHGVGTTSVVGGGTLIRALIFGPLAQSAPPPPLFSSSSSSASCGCGSTPSSSSAAAAVLPNTFDLAPPPPRSTLHSFAPPSDGVRIGILTVSDSAAQGQSSDESGPLAAALLATVLTLSAPPLRATVADDARLIILQLQKWASPLASSIPLSPLCDLIITTGGTGFGVRDVTPEATAAVLTKRAPGFVAVMLAAGLAVTPRAALSRPEAGVREGCGPGGRGTLIINLPGSPKAVKECLTPLLSLLPHALSLIKG